MLHKLNNEEPLEVLNNDRAVVEIKGRVRIVGWEKSEIHPDLEVAVFSTVPEMKTLYANQFVDVAKTDGNGNTVFKRTPVFQHWLERPDRPTAHGVTIDPKGGRFVDGQLNLWKGYGAEPEPGDWTLLERHIVEVICNGNKELADFVIRWIAFCLQNPTKPAEVVLVLRGAKGSGKGILARLIRQLHGIHGLQISDRTHLIGHFNAHLLQTCLLYADEAFWPGDKSGEGALKRIITEPTLFIEPKGMDPFEVPNRLSIIMTSNEDWVVPATSDERRFAVIDVSDKKCGDFFYFNALDFELEFGGAAAFLHDMLHMDLGGWLPREHVPHTSGLADQQAASAPPLVNWLGAILEEGALPMFARDSAGEKVRVVHQFDPALARPALLLDFIRGRDQRLRHTSDVVFWKFLDEHGITKADDRRDRQGRYRRFPPLEEARQTFRRKYPWWPEFSQQVEQWRFESHPDFL